MGRAVVSASGKLRALNTFKIGSEVSGQVTAVYVDFNSPVRAGQVLRPHSPVKGSAATGAIEIGLTVPT